MSQPNLSSVNYKQSILGNEWVLSNFDENELKAVQTKYSLSDLTLKILLNRGINKTNIESFLDVTLKKNIPDPNLLKDMAVSVDRIIEALTKKEKIGIIGDYDVDGIVSSSILFKYLTFFEDNVIVRIPDRVTDGYGPNQKIIDEFKDQGVNLIITVDCGTSSNEIFKNNSNFDFIVIDHHQVTEINNRISMINPNRDDDKSGLGYLCAAGVVFLTLVALNTKLREKNYYLKENIQEPSILQYLPLVSMATVADIVPLINLNRSIVTQGLKAIKKFPNLGMNAISEISNLTDDISYNDFGYVFGPRINAGGRIGHSSMGFTLLTSTDNRKARELAERLDNLNTERKFLEENSTNEAIQLYQDKFLYDKFIVLESKDWHPGIIGLIASRLSSRYNKPCFIISNTSENLQTGSARSVYGIDVGFIISELIKARIIHEGGGHEMAAGFKIKREKIDELRAFLNSRTWCDDTKIKKNKFFDATLMASAVTIQLIEEINSVGPYGNSFEEPKFLFPAHTIKNLTMINNQHISLNLIDKNNFYLKGISFRSVGTPLGSFLVEHSYKSLNFYGGLNINRWGGNIKPQLIIEDVELIE